MQEIEIKSLEEIDTAAEEFLRAVADCRIFAFYAPMGCGKTTFITAVCRCLGITDVVNSPTFAIANRYTIPNSLEKVYHIDCYRIEKLEDALNLGFEDYLCSGARCFIEWPEIVEPLLPEDTLAVYMAETPQGIRRISFQPLECQTL